MKALQYIYTSWKNGRSDHKGFMVYTQTEGITTKESEEIRDQMRYYEPSDVKHGEHSEDLSRYPQNFSYFSLSSGRLCIANATALGKDYSGRPGNFIIYALVFEAEALDLFPVDVYKNPAVRTFLTEEELELQEKPAPLPPLELRPSPELSIEALSQFLSDGREDLFTALLAAVLSGREKKIPVFINDTPDNIVRWFALVQKSFPLHLASSLTFSSYLFDFSDKALAINGVRSEGVNFDYPSRVNAPNCYVFDFIGGKISSNIPISKFASFAKLGLGFSYESLQSFHRFLSGFSLHKIDKCIDDAFTLYKIIENDVYGLAAADFAGAIAFEGNFGRGENMPKILQTVRQNQDVFIFEAPVETASAMLSYLCKTGAVDGEVGRTLLDFICYRLNDGMSVQEAFTVMDGILDAGRRDAFVAYLTTNATLRAIVEICEDGIKPECAIFLAKYILRGADRLPSERMGPVAEIMKFLTKPLYGDVGAFLSVMEDALPYRAIAVPVFTTYVERAALSPDQKKRLYREADKLENGGRRLGEVLSGGGMPLAITIDMFVAQLGESKNPTADFHALYTRQVLPQLNRQQINLDSVLLPYLDLRTSDQKEEVVKIVAETDPAHFVGTQAAGRLLGILNELPVAELVALGNTFLARIGEIERVSRSGAPVDAARVCYTFNSLVLHHRAASVSRLQDSLRDLCGAIQSLGRGRSRECLEVCLAPLLKTYSDLESVGTIIESFSGYEDAFVSCYLDALKSFEKKEKATAEQLYAHTAVYLINQKVAPESKFYRAFLQAYGGLGSGLEKQISTRIISKTVGKESSQFFDRVEAAQKPGIAKFFGGFKKKP